MGESVTSNPKNELQRFAESLIRIVRDGSIEASDRLACGEMRRPAGEYWRAVSEHEEARAAVLKVIPEIVDQVLFELLNAIDNGEMPIGWRTKEGQFVSLEELGGGEMGGWLMGSPGWRHQYSSQRFVDSNEGLQLDLGSFRKTEEDSTEN